MGREQGDIGALRERMWMSQREFAELFGVSVRTVQGWESGASNPNNLQAAVISQIARISEAVNAKAPRVLIQIVERLSGNAVHRETSYEVDVPEYIANPPSGVTP